MVAEENSKAPPKARNCAGVLYFSSLRKSRARNPFCFGLSRAERNARYTGEKFKSDPRALLNFKYACVGYSIHDDTKASSSTSDTEKRSDLPLCMGIEVLVEKRAASQEGARDRHLNNKEDHERKEVMPISQRPPSSIGNSRTSGPDDLIGARFIRSAGLVAGAVVKNLSRIGNSIKTAATDIFHSDRGRPK